MLADVVVGLHLAFVLFAVLGGLLVIRWKRVVWLHIPAVVWAALIEFAGWICPLTPLENRFRALGGGSGYAGGFVDHYILPVLYPSGLTRQVQFALGAFVVLINLAIYGYLLRGRATTRSQERTGNGDASE